MTDADFERRFKRLPIEVQERHHLWHQAMMLEGVAAMMGLDIDKDDILREVGLEDVLNG